MKSLSLDPLTFFAKLQEAVAKVAYPVEDRIFKVEKVCGVDAAHVGEKSGAAAVVYDLKSTETVEKVVRVFRFKKTPYIPGFLMLREGPPLLEVLSAVKTGFDLLLVDGHGRAHPRRCGLATILGFITGFPSVGVAKSLLVGELRPENDFYQIVVDGEVIGLRRGPAYYSQGYGVSFNDLRKIVELFGGRYPQALREADRLSKESVKKTR